MSMYWIVAVLYTVLNVVSSIKELKESESENKYYAFIAMILGSLLLTPIAIFFDIY